MHYQLILGGLAAGLQLYSFLPYFVGIFKRRVKPHAFTWLIWALLSGITYAAQFSDHAGAGAWMTGINTLACFVTAVLAFIFGTKNVQRSDWCAFIFGLMAIPVWMITHHPLGSVVIVCIIDTVAFWPTVRKTWFEPQDESIQTFLLSGEAAAIALLALEHVTWVTALYPAVLCTLNLCFILMVILRRRVVNH